MTKKTAKNRKSGKLAENRVLVLLDRVISRLDRTSLKSSLLWSAGGLLALGSTSLLLDQGVSSILVATAGAALVFFLIWRFSAAEDRSFLIATFAAGLFLRLITLVFLHSLSVKLGYGGFLSQFDPKSYDSYAMFIVKGWQKGQFIDIRAWNLAGTWDIGYYYFLAVLYFLFGHSTLMGKAANCLIGAILPVVIFYLVASVFNRPLARYSALLVAFSPNLIYWSAYDLMKDTLASLLLYTSILFALKIEKKNLVYPCLVVLFLTALRLNRFYIGMIMTVLIGFFYLVRMLKDRRVYRHVVVFVILIFAVEGLLVYGFHFPSFIMPLKSEIPTYSGGMMLKRLIKPEQESFAGIKEFLGYFLKNPTKFATQLTYGAIVFTLGPFAWIIPSSFSWDAFLFPGMWLWYLLIPFALYGLIFSKKEPHIILLILIVLSFFCIYSFLFSGGGFRHREQIMPILLVFSAIGLLQFKTWQRFYPYYLGLLALGVLSHLIVRSLV